MTLLLKEYRDVFSRPKFAHVPSTWVETMLNMIESADTRFTPDRQRTLSAHDSDNRFYECADAAGADYIVTGNLKHFTKPHKNTKVVNTRELLELLAEITG